MRAWSLALLLALACQAQAGRQLSWDWSAKSLQALNEPVANAPATDLVLSGCAAQDPPPFLPPVHPEPFQHSLALVPCNCSLGKQARQAWRQPQRHASVLKCFHALHRAYPGSPQTAPAAVEAPAAAAGALPLLGALAPLGSAESAMTAGAPDYVVYVGPPQPQQPPVLGAPGPNGGGPVFPQLGPLAPAEGPAAAQLAAGAPSHLFPGFPVWRAPAAHATNRDTSIHLHSGMNNPVASLIRGRLPAQRASMWACTTHECLKHQQEHAGGA